MNFYVYILFNASINKYYIGSTQNIENRLIYHNKSHNKKYTSKQKGIWVLKYKEEFETRNLAVQRELYLKSRKSRVYIENLIYKS